MAGADMEQTAQAAQMMERLNNLGADIQELKVMLVSVISMQRDMAHMDEKVRRLFVLADANGPEVAKIDKRLTSLERWHKVVGALAIASIGLVGWGINRIEYLYKMDTRISVLELIVNGQSIERTMEAPKIAGPK